MQIKITQIPHLTPVRMDNNKSIDDNLHWRGCGVRITPPLLVELQTCIATLEISMPVSQKTGNQSTSRLSNTTPVYISKGYSIIAQGHLLNNVHSSIICNNQNQETT